jgi:hypothetical protein
MPGASVVGTSAHVRLSDDRARGSVAHRPTAPGREHHIMASNKELQAEIEALKAQLAAANKPKAAGELTFRIGPSGAVCVYGLGRYPTTLYASQWPRLFAAKDRLVAFIDANQNNPAMSKGKTDKPATADAPHVEQTTETETEQTTEQTIE